MRLNFFSVLTIPNIIPGMEDLNKDYLSSFIIKKGKRSMGQARIFLLLGITKAAYITFFAYFSQ
jgi:hypothetical protein